MVLGLLVSSCEFLLRSLRTQVYHTTRANPGSRVLCLANSVAVQKIGKDLRFRHGNGEKGDNIPPAARFCPHDLEVSGLWDDIIS